MRGRVSVSSLSLSFFLSFLEKEKKKKKGLEGGIIWTIYVSEIDVCEILTAAQERNSRREREKENDTWNQRTKKCDRCEGDHKMFSPLSCSSLLKFFSSRVMNIGSIVCSQSSMILAQFHVIFPFFSFFVSDPERERERERENITTGERFVPLFFLWCPRGSWFFPCIKPRTISSSESYFTDADHWIIIIFFSSSHISFSLFLCSLMTKIVTLTCDVDGHRHTLYWSQSLCCLWLLLSAWFIHLFLYLLSFELLPQKGNNGSKAGIVRIAFYIFKDLLLLFETEFKQREKRDFLCVFKSLISVPCLRSFMG